MTTMAAPEPTDAALAAAARGGDRQAFARLVERWQRPLFARALRSTRSVPDADDLVQETFLRAWRHLDRFRNDARFGAWVLQILGHLATDRARRRGREVALPDDASEVADRRPGPEAQLLAGELERSVREALVVLPAGRQREVFRMRFVEGRPLQEIAQTLGVHTGTVKVHLFRLARDLRKRLRGQEG